MTALVATVACALAIGVTLGLLGAGGSILTVPLLTFVADQPPRAAISSSLFAVAVTAAVAVIGHARAGRVRWRIGLAFGLAGMGGAYGGGRLSAHVPERALMILFGAIMVVAAIAMLRRGDGAKPGVAGVAAATDGEEPRPRALAVLALQGAVVGALTGLIDTGGNFIIVPALVLLARQPMHAAVGTSLFIITLNAVAGLLGHLGQAELDWTVTLAVTGAMIGGSLGGVALAGRVPAARLRTGFALFVLATAAVVLVSQA